MNMVKQSKSREENKKTNFDEQSEIIALISMLDIQFQLNIRK
jgi:hypothetical protein